MFRAFQNVCGEMRKAGVK